MAKIKLYEEFQALALFWHQNRLKDLSVLMPQSYEAIEKMRGHAYIDGRMEAEIIYHEMLKTSDPGMSFLYATVVGCNKMTADPDLQSYYFVLTDDQMEKALFEIVDARHSYGPFKGRSGLEKAQRFWKKHNESFKPYDDPVVGTIEPRIEVIIPFDVTIKKKILKLEDLD